MNPPPNHAPSLRLRTPAEIRLAARIGRSMAEWGDWLAATRLLGAVHRQGCLHLGHHHPATNSVLDTLAHLFWRRGHFADELAARRLFHAAIAAKQAPWRAEHWRSLAALGKALLRVGSHEEAHAALHAAAWRRSRGLGRLHASCPPMNPTTRDHS